MTVNGQADWCRRSSPRDFRRTGKDSIHRRGIATRTMRGKSRVRPGEFQHRCGNGIASLPQASRLAGLSEKRGQIRGVIKMGVIGHHMHRPGSGKGHVLLSIRLAIGGLDTTGRIGIPGGALHFNQGRAQLSTGFLDARVSGQLHHLGGGVIRCSLRGGSGRRAESGRPGARRRLAGPKSRFPAARQTAAGRPAAAWGRRAFLWSPSPRAFRG